MLARIAIMLGVKKPAKITVYQRMDSTWGWTMRGSNGEIQASGEGYTRKSSAKRGAAAFKRNASTARIVCEETP